MPHGAPAPALGEGPLPILLVEDVPSDAELMIHELGREGVLCSTRRVWTQADLREALRDFAPAIVLSDHSLPQLRGYDVLHIVQQERPYTPVIIVTGSIDEETAAEYIKAGAADYVVKHRLFRLVPAVRRALELRDAQNALRDLEERHRHIQKMEAMGRLASSVAHDFNNLLTVITACCDLVLEELTPDAPARVDVLEMRKAADRATGLTRQLLAFSRRQEMSPQRVDLNGLVANMTGMLHRLLGARVTTVFAATSGLDSVWADPGQLEQVLLNLAVNARDAMPDGGELLIQLSNVEVGDAHAIAHEVAPGRFVLLAVTDTGTGMDAQTKERLFEPFFTTKEKGKGTGLGLSTVYGIVQQAGGFIEVMSEPSQGSTFNLYLPRATP